MNHGAIHITSTLAAGRNSYGSYEDTPKTPSSHRTVTLDSATFAVTMAWREVQQRQRKEWETKHRNNPEKYGPYIDSGYVYTMHDGRPWNPANVSVTFKRILKRLDLPPIRLHDLRHCAASLSLAAGLSMKAIQALLGHSSYTITADTYTSLMPQFDQEAAEAPVAIVPRATTPPHPTPPSTRQTQPAPTQQPNDSGDRTLTLVKDPNRGTASTEAA